MGVVNQVQDKVLRRSVAMKQLSAESAKDREVTRTLLTEARVAGMLEHPNIIPVYDVGQLENGIPFYTMRLMDSLSLADVLDLLRAGHQDDQQRYPLVYLIRIFRSVCLGVDYAHRRGVIHRDLKPENVRLGRFGEVQLADWGLAKVRGTPDLAYEKALRDAADHGDEPLCVVIGTPNYMSPEQACGLNDQIAPTSDIYSLGCILYEMLTLITPQDDVDTMILLDKVEQEDVIAPSERAPQRIIPPILEQICMECLEKDPLTRVQDARVLIKVLEDFMDGDRLRTENDVQVFEELQRGQRYSDAYMRLSKSREEFAQRQVQEGSEEGAGQIENEVEALSLDIAAAWGEAHMAYTRALGFNPKDLIARAKLAELAWHRLHNSELNGDTVNCRLQWSMLLRYNDGAYDRLIKGNGELLVESEPIGAVITLTDLVDPICDPRQDNGRGVGLTPVEVEDMKSGLYLVTASMEGYESLTWPVFLESNTRRKVIMELQPVD